MIVANVSNQDLLSVITGEDPRAASRKARVEKVIGRIELEAVAFFGVIMILWTIKEIF